MLDYSARPNATLSLTVYQVCLYRQMLTDMLQQHGVQASDRDVRWLSRMLDPPATDTVDTVETTDTDTTETDDTDDPAGT
jgi:hypothetical protein